MSSVHGWSDCPPLTTCSKYVNRWCWGQIYSRRYCIKGISLQWCRNEHDGISNHQPHDCLLNHLFRHRSKKTSKVCITGLCEGNSPVTHEFPVQRASNAEKVSIWRRHVTMNVCPWLHILTQWAIYEYAFCLWCYAYEYIAQKVSICNQWHTPIVHCSVVYGI